MSENSQYYNVCFTLNNYGEGEWTSFLEWKECSYLCMGREVGDSGTPHIQGYIELKKKKSLRTLKKFNSRAHWEPRRGTGEQAATYCKKDGNFVETGKIKTPGQGKRNDLASIPELLNKHKSVRGILKERECNIQQIRTAEKYLTYLEEPRNWKPHVTWIWGASGVGKSKLAWQLSEASDTYSKDGEKWWDGYDGHETVIMDDFRAGNMKFNYLLKVLDRYPLRVEFKGGYRQLRAKKIIITTILHPENVYQLEGEPIKQLIRRIDDVIFVREEIEGPRFVEVGEVANGETEVGGNTDTPTSNVVLDTSPDDPMWCDIALRGQL